MFKGTVKPVTCHEDPERYRGIALFFFYPRRYVGVGCQPHIPVAFPPGGGGRPYTHFTGGWVRKISLPPEFDPRTVQPVPIGGRTWLNKLLSRKRQFSKLGGLS